MTSCLTFWKYLQVLDASNDARDDFQVSQFLEISRNQLEIFPNFPFFFFWNVTSSQSLWMEWKKLESDFKIEREELTKKNEEISGFKIECSRLLKKNSELENYAQEVSGSESFHSSLQTLTAIRIHPGQRTRIKSNVRHQKASN